MSSPISALLGSIQNLAYFEKFSPKYFVVWSKIATFVVLLTTSEHLYFMKYSELEAELKAAGCWVVRKGGNHLIWYSPLTDKKFPLGHHGSKEVPPPTERSVRRLAGVKKL